MMGIIKKFKISASTIDDKEIKDGLEALSQLNGREPYFLVGGIAAQSYLPSSCRRPTSDIDNSILRPLNYSDFLNVTKPVQEFMKDQGYDVRPSKGSRAFSLYCTNNEGYETIIEFVRRNKKNFDKHRKRLEREFENTNRKIIEERKSTYSVKRPEDIVVPKLVRMINSFERNPNFSRYLSKELGTLNKETINRKLKRINDTRAEVMHHPGDMVQAENLRFISDLYDIRILAEIAGFNEDYFKIAESDWRDINKDNKIRNKILKSTFPKFLDNIY